MRCDRAIGLSVPGHPLRSVKLAGPLLPASSLHMLKAAHLLRQQGLLPPGVDQLQTLSKEKTETGNANVK